MDFADRPPTSPHPPPRAGRRFAEFVRADAESVAEVERFLSGALDVPVCLAGVRMARGRLGRTLAAVSGASAVTFGHTIALAAGFAARLDALRAEEAPDGRLAQRACLDALGELFVHECVHVWQYSRLRKPKFLAKYLLSYYTNITRGQNLSRASRALAYRAIPFEKQAYDLAARWLRERA